MPSASAAEVFLLKKQHETGYVSGQRQCQEDGYEMPDAPADTETTGPLRIVKQMDGKQAIVWQNQQQNCQDEYFRVYF